MRRRYSMASAALVLVLVLFALAASSSWVSPWVNPPSNRDAPATSDTVAPEDPTGGSSGTNGDDRAASSLSAIGIAITMVAGLFVLFAAWTIARGMVMWGVPRFRIHRRRAMPELDPLAEDPRLDLPPEIATDTAKLILTEGVPRNAIVACWMQLEAETAWAGFPRLDHETSAEYVERVIATASVDPRPITQLSALYREARFSAHPIDETHRATAIDALGHVERSLLGRIGTLS